MDHEARRRACVEFRDRLSLDTEVYLSVADCEVLLVKTFEGEGGEEISLQSNPGLFFARLGELIAKQMPAALVVTDTLKVAWWCYREAAEVHSHPEGSRKLAECYFFGRGVTPDPEQADVWYQKAADLGDANSMVALGVFLVHGDAHAEVAKDPARGFALLRQAFAEGFTPALFRVARCYLGGQGVEKDAAHGVSLLRQVINQNYELKANAEKRLAFCYLDGIGVEADTVQAALWCRKAVTSVDQQAIELLALIRECDFCGTTPARQLCVRCMKVRYCDHQCQLAHWTRETDGHKGPCKEHRRRAAEACQQEAGGASPSALQ